MPLPPLEWMELPRMVLPVANGVVSVHMNAIAGVEGDEVALTGGRAADGVALGAARMCTPVPLGRAAVPAGVGADVVALDAVVVPPGCATPYSLPEITLRSAGVLPPTVVLPAARWYTPFAVRHRGGAGRRPCRCSSP